MMNKQLLTASALACLVGMGAFQAQAASVTVVDRGLPSDNLNNAAGSDRSNVAWGFNGDFQSGDDFELGSTGDADNPYWQIDKLTVWVVSGAPDADTTLGDAFDDVSLYLGDADGATTPLAKSANLTGNVTDNADVAVSKVNYDGGADYQGSSGSFISIFQVDFMDLGTFAPDEYVFSLGGTSDGANPFMHASNAALSGTPQDGANGEYRWFSGVSGDPSINVGGTIDSNGNGWDKSSDINVQVQATAVPSPTAAFGGLVMLGGLAMRRRRRA